MSFDGDVDKYAESVILIIYIYCLTPSRAMVFEGNPFGSL